MTLDDEDAAVLAHVLVNWRSWVDHAVATVGESAVTAKLTRWRAPYLEARIQQGADYKTRAEREAGR